MVWRDLISKNIITHLKLQNLEESQRLMLLTDIADLLQKQIMVRLIEFLNEEEIGELLHLLEHNDDKALSIFLDEKVPHLEEIIFEELGTIKKDLGDFLN